ncbi:MAG: sigma-70 family RNA polymerase sigma factor [Planctomycetes bacterium]|jgi:RNA polymerase sigma factor (sigma-70 family)|nr:sigma-70 family RNA polymerase sigma factor [Planctomycetota bacterium]
MPEPDAPDDDPTLALMQRWHQGDQEALHTLIQRELPWLRMRTRQRLGANLRAHGNTDDFLHEVLLDVLRYTPRFLVGDQDTFRRIVGTILENALRSQGDFYGRMRRDRQRQSPLPDDSVLLVDQRARTATSPSRHASRNEEEAWLRLALEMLAPDDRELIAMREWQQLGFTEIGARLAIPENTARMRFQRALTRLADRVVSLRRGFV